MPSLSLSRSRLPVPLGKRRPSFPVNLPARWRRFAAALVLLATGAGLASAQDPQPLDPQTTQKWQALREKLATRQAEIVQRPALGETVLTAGGIVKADSSRRGTLSFSKIAASESTAVTETLTEAAEAAAPTPSAAPPPVEPPALVAGQMYRVALAHDEEQLAADVLKSRIAGFSRANTVASFPGIVRQVATNQQAVDLKPFVLAGKALTLDRPTGEFKGSIRIGVADLSNPTEGLALSAPMTFNVLEADLADPSQVALDKTSPPLETIRIHTPVVEEPFVVRVASQFDLAGVPVTLRVSPTLFVQTDREVIQGYGLETASVYVWTVGVSTPKGRTVQLRAKPSAHFAQSRLILDEEGRAETHLRSDASGPVTLTASMAGLGNADYPIQFDRPWRTLAFSLVGGLLGGLIRVAPGFRPGSRLARPVIALFVSVLIGALVFALTALGVNVLPVEFAVRSGDIFVFAVSALGAWLGTAALRPIAA